MMRFTKTRYVLMCLLIPYLLLIGTPQGDFEMAESAYDQGMYTIAHVYLENLLQENPLSPHVPDAIYYLIQIYDIRGDFTDMISFANRFLVQHKYDHRCQEIFDLLLERLAEKNAYAFAYDYIKKYDHFATDYSLLEDISYGLLEQKQQLAADYVLSLCPQTDTIKIIRAQMRSNTERKMDILKTIDGAKGDIYLIEHYLVNGDTISAYEIYQQIPKADVNTDLIYRFSKIALLFEKTIVKEFTAKLGKSKGFSNKRILLDALATGYLEKAITPEDEEEMQLLIKIYEMDSVSTVPPEGINLDSMFSSALEIHTAIEPQNNYYLDSVYSEMLIDENRIEEADKIMSQYLSFVNVSAYARSVKAKRYFENKDYKRAMINIILSNDKRHETTFLLAECLKNLDKNAAFLYAEVVNATEDSALHSRALKGLIESEFANKNYSGIINYTIEDLRNDTMLIELYAKSLAGTGQKEKADAIFQTYFSGFDYEIANYYGEFLIQNKNYQYARNYYDSLTNIVSNHMPENVYYNWALVSFLQAMIDTALVRFNFYIKNFKNTGNYYRALFKVATINYAQEHYDTAAYYYSRASEDSSLRLNALQNQLICYKKSGNWHKVIEAGSKILDLVSGDEAADVKFDIGYAFLRAGRAKQALEHLKIAARIKSTPEYYYWLGEAYLTRGDLMRALYQYQRIVDFFPKDDMWSPTALYKTGIVLEFMDELETARKVYEKIIKTRGLGDVWGAEAQKRLEELE